VARRASTKIGSAGAPREAGEYMRSHVLSRRTDSGRSGRLCAGDQYGNLDAGSDFLPLSASCGGRFEISRDGQRIYFTDSLYGAITGDARRVVERPCATAHLAGGSPGRRVISAPMRSRRSESCRISRASAYFANAARSATSTEPCVGARQAVGQRVTPLVRINSAIWA
jgi:hypothetical protein